MTLHEKMNLIFPNQSNTLQLFLRKTHMLVDASEIQRTRVTKGLIKSPSVKSDSWKSWVKLFWTPGYQFMHNFYPSNFKTFHLMRHIVRRNMTGKCMKYSVKVAIQLINSCFPTIWRYQIGRISRRHSVYYPCFTRQEMVSLSTLKCLKWWIPLTYC